MEKRTEKFLEVSFYLSKFGHKINEGIYPDPPKRLKVNKWNMAYRVFYQKLNGGRTILAFERSLKNARDAFDSHLQLSGRIGWLSHTKAPNPLGKEAQRVLDKLTYLSEEEVWNLIKDNADLKVKDYEVIINDIISIQESESEYKKVKTEGGKKVVTLSKYERDFSLRNDALKIHGHNCMVCGFNYEEKYGEWGKNFIEVHHIKSLSSSQGEEIITNPETDLAVLCANCHRMVHRKREIVLTIDELKNKLIK